ncbi:MAG: tetratricopeptide repeat protein, partial [bacterium]
MLKYVKESLYYGDRDPNMHRRYYLVAGCVLLFLLGIIQVPSTVQGQSFIDSFQQNRDYRAGVGLLSNGNYQLAERQFTNFLRQYDTSLYQSKVLFGLGEAHYLQNEYDSAVQNYLKSVSTGDTLPGDLLKTAFNRGITSAKRAPNRSAGEALIDRISEYYHTPPDTIIQSAISFLESNKQIDRAIELARKQHERDTDSRRWTYQLGRLYAVSKQYVKAIPLLEKTADTGPYRNDATYLRAEIALDRGNTKQARTLYNSLLTTDRYRRDGIYGLAWINIQNNKLNKAAKHLKELAESTGVLRVDASRDLARIYRRQEKHQKAENWYIRAIQRANEPLQSQLRLELGDYFVNRNELERAVPFYESARSLPVKSEKRLIRGYVSLNHYEKALKHIRNNQNKNRLTGPRWQYYKSLSLYRMDQSDSAIHDLPDPSSVKSDSLKPRIRKLKGRIHYDRGEWELARKTYLSWYKNTHDPEPKYYLGLTEERSGNRNNAKKHWKTLLEDQPGEPWKSRTAYQLARLAIDRGNHKQFESYQTDIDTSQLSPNLRLEFGLLSITHWVNTEKFEKSYRRKSRAVLNRAQQQGRVEDWYRHLIDKRLPLSWWNKLLLPVIHQHQSVRNSLSGRVLSVLRKNGWYNLTLKTGQRILSKELPIKTKLSVQTELMKTARISNNIDSLDQYIPPRKLWSKLSRDQVRQTGYHLTLFYRKQGQPKTGLKKLQQLSTNISKKGRVQRLLDEWIASFHIDLGNYRKARRILEPYGKTLTLSAELNHAITKFYLGDTTASFKHITTLRDRWDSPPINLYDYAFRMLRARGDTHDLINWSNELSKRSDFNDTRVVKLQLKNAQFWIQRGPIPRALKTLQSLIKRPVGVHTQIPLVYFKGVAYFNSNKLKKALRTLNNLKTNFPVNQDWTYRILRTKTEIHLRRGNWNRAYTNWQKLAKIGPGGEVGIRLLDQRAIAQAPKRFRQLLKTLESNYSKYFPEHKRDFWWGRLREHRGEDTGAIKRYREYLNTDDTERQKTVRNRLASLYENRGNHKSAFQQYLALYKSTDHPRYLVLMAVQDRKLGNIKRATKHLNRALNQWPSKKHW